MLSRQEMEAAAEQFGRTVAGHFLERVVDIDRRHSRQSRVGNDDAVVGRLHCAPQQPQIDLVAIALGDVEHAADRADRAAVRIAQQRATIEHLGVTAVLAQQAIAVFPFARIGRDRAIEAVGDARAIVGMQHRIDRVPRRADLVALVAEHREIAVAAPGGAGGHVPVPDRIVGRARDQLEALFVALAFGDVQRQHQPCARALELDLARMDLCTQPACRPCAGASRCCPAAARRDRRVQPRARPRHPPTGGCRVSWPAAAPRANSRSWPAWRR